MEVPMQYDVMHISALSVKGRIPRGGEGRLGSSARHASSVDLKERNKSRRTSEGVQVRVEPDASPPTVKLLLDRKPRVKRKDGERVLRRTYMPSVKTLVLE